MITNAFTCTGPYAILTLLGIKRVENRSAMPVPAKGRCAVTCNKTFCEAEYGNFVQWASRALPPEEFARVPAWADVKDWPGKVVGCCDYAARQAGAAESWNEGYPFFWELSNIVCLDQPIPCRGNVGMWQMPEALATTVTAADALSSCVGEKVATAEDAARLFRLAIPLAGDNEGLFVLPLDAERRALAAPELVSLGESATTVVSPADVFAAAFRVGAASIILAHNHPSGNLAPSVQDRITTLRLKRLGVDLGIELLDHLIIGAETVVRGIPGGDSPRRVPVGPSGCCRAFTRKCCSARPRNPNGFATRVMCSVG